LNHLISVILALIAHYVWNSTYKADWVNIACHLAYLNNFVGGQYLNPEYWTLGIEFQFYLFLALCFPFFATKLGPFAYGFCLLVEVPFLKVSKNVKYT
jgi:peptidoglycan/LPS O-acetylase OafA/YrhL